MKLLESIVIEENGQLTQIEEGAVISTNNDLIMLWESYNQALKNTALTEQELKSINEIFEDKSAKDIGQKLASITTKIGEIGISGIAKLIPLALKGANKLTEPVLKIVDDSSEALVE